MSRDPLISIVDDDASLREALGGLVRSLGYEAATYADAEAFLAAGGARESACVVTDLQMPGMSGLDLLLQLRRAGSAAPVILITARTEAALETAAGEAGALCLLRKPFAAEELILALDRALSGR